MSPSLRALPSVLALIVTLVLLPRDVRGNAATVDFRLLDSEGSAHHVLPRSSGGARMRAERVVLVPYLDPASRRAHVLVHAAYDLVGSGAPGSLRVGYPEVKGVHRRLGDERSPRLGTSEPTIAQLAARLEGRLLAVQAHPGVGRYRRWFTFGIPFRAAETVRLDVRYVSRVGRDLRVSFSSGNGPGSPGHRSATAEYWIDYVLHTGAMWAGPIGQGEVLLSSAGRLSTLRRFQNLRPTPRDDLTVRLPLGRIDWPRDDGSGYGHIMGVKDWAAREHLDDLGLVQQSSVLPGDGLDSLGALAVDGDPATGWISAPQKAVGSWLQIPADPGRALESVGITGLSRAGVARPARLEARCLSRVKGTIRSVLLATHALPDTAGPHRLPAGAVRGCAALRLQVLAVHGGPAAPVGIAEVEQRYATAAPPLPAGVKLVPCCHPTVGEPSVALDRQRPLLARLPAARLRWGWEIDQVSDVRWSRDGTLVHYLRWLESEHHEPRAVLMGHIEEVATGKVVRRYRLDQAGDLPEPERSQWAAAMSPDEGARFLEQRGFVPAIVARSPPRGTPTPLDLRADLPPLVGRLRTQARPTGFSWWYEPNPAAPLQPRAPGVLRLVPGGARATPVTERRPDLDHAHARLHAQVRERRGPLVAAKLREYQETGNAPGPVTAAALLYSLFPRIHAFSGAVVLHWHPQGRAVLVAWQDVVELTALLPDTLLRSFSYEGALARPWNRLDYGRVRTHVTVHPLPPRPAARP